MPENKMTKQQIRDEYRHITKPSGKHYGQHVMVTAYGCGDAIRDIDKMKQFLVELGDHIKMIRFQEPMVYRFGEGIDVGLSGAQFITTSLISFHTNDAAGDLYLDVFSCKEFSAEEVEKYVREFLEPDDTKVVQLWRD